MGINLGIKNPKGTVSIEKYRAQIRLRWRFLGKRYCLSLFHYNKSNLKEARKKAILIEQDMLLDQFDATLRKYRVNNVDEEILQEKTIVQYFEEWASVYRQMDCENHSDYFHLRNTIKRWCNFDETTALEKLNAETFGAKTYNERLSMLRSFSKWLVKGNIWQNNPFEDVCRKKVKKSLKADREPFTEQEITKILEAIKNNTYCPKGSRYKHSHYYPFMYFLFKTGVRPAEAVGLKVGNVDFKGKTISIDEVLARTLKGTNAAARIRKETKNGKVRLLPLTDDLSEILSHICSSRSKADLVFQSVTGLSIDDRMFQRRIFKPVLKGLKIKNRVLYACRHTFGSRCIDAGITPVMTAFLMGNNPETALRNYTHQINLPQSLPEI